VATLASPDASELSAKPRKLDDSDAPGPILRPCTRLRALWGDFPVVVRVHSGACKKSASQRGCLRSEASRRHRGLVPPIAAGGKSEHFSEHLRTVVARLRLLGVPQVAGTRGQPLTIGYDQRLTPSD
jgi:hypothetical protein